jgi:hypothetical protein
MSVKPAVAKALISLLVCCLIQIIGESQARAKGLQPQNTPLPQVNQPPQQTPVIPAEQAAFLRQLFESKIDVFKLKSLESDFGNKLIQESLDTKLAIEKLKNELSDEKEKLSASELTLGGHVVSVIILLLTIFGVVSYFIYDKIENRATQNVLKLLETKSEEIMREAAMKECLISNLETFSLIAYPFWENYDEKYQEHMRRRMTDPTELNRLVREIRIPRDFSRSGINLLEYYKKKDGSRKDGVEKYVKSSERGIAMYAMIINHFVYHETAYLLCGGGDGNEYVDRVNKVIEAADECIKAGEDIRCEEQGLHWYDFYETAARALAKLGNEASKNRASKMIQSLFEGRTPGPDFPPAPPELLSSILEDYFPLSGDGKTRKDLFGLGFTPSS